MSNYCYWCEAKLPEVIDIKRFAPVDEHTYGYIDHIVPLSLLKDKNDMIICPSCGKDTSICDIDALLEKHRKKPVKEEKNERTFQMVEIYKKG